MYESVSEMKSKFRLPKYETSDLIVLFLLVVSLRRTYLMAFEYNSPPPPPGNLLRNVPLQSRVHFYAHCFIFGFLS